MTGGRCLHDYFYFLDEPLGLGGVRVPTWRPFRRQVYFNQHQWLAHPLRDRDGTSGYQVADLKKSIFSLGDLRGLLRAGCARSLELVGELEERSPGQTNLDQIRRPAQDRRERSWRGFNFFLGGELSVLLAIVRRISDQRVEQPAEASGAAGQEQRPDRADTQTAAVAWPDQESRPDLQILSDGSWAAERWSWA